MRSAASLRWTAGRELRDSADDVPTSDAIAPSPPPLSPALRDLVDALEAVGPSIGREDAVAVLGRAQLGLDDVRAFVQPSAHGYARMRVARTEAYEVLVMTWLPGQGSIPHDHAGSVCALRIVQGRVRERRFRPAIDGLVDATTDGDLVEGEVMVDASEDIHALGNPSDAAETLVTVHVYAPPLPELRRFAARSEAGGPVRAFIEAPGPEAPVVAIVGGGFSGTLAAAHLVARASAAGRAVHVVLLDRQATFGEGPAYRTPDPHHLLNVPAANMGAWASRPRGFLEWSQRRRPETQPYEFLPRKRYGEYVRETFLETVAAAGPGVTVESRRAEVDAVSRTGDQWRVESAGHAPLLADAVILATGHRPPDDPLRSSWHGPRSRYVQDPWATLVLSAIRPDETVVLLGSGLTAIDVVLSLGKTPRSAPLVALSRRGLFPAAHAPTPQPPRDPSSWLEPLLSTPGALGARALLHAVRAAVREAQAQGADWRSVIDGLRPHTPRLWRALPEAEARRFLRVVRPFWEVHRHRMPPEVAAQVAALRAAGALRFQAARIVDAQATGEEVLLRLKERGGDTLETLRADWVVNCTGPGAASTASSTPVVRSLVEGGWLEPDPFGLGVHADAVGRALVDGSVVDSLLVIGTLRKATQWESTAVPELRVQASDAARAVATTLGWPAPA
jgi:uncharacterized NAD(P)/FAD-binding protein YdhS/predicted metal-dependent enzyme (double-stranded beta helix superfamily)